MSTSDSDLEETAGTEDAGTATAEDQEPKRKLALDVQISDVGPCKKHVKVAIPRPEIDRQFEESLGELRREAAVPGFRPGRAPQKLVGRRFRKEVAGQVKSALLAASLEQIEEDYKLNAISQPTLDVAAIDLPDEGPMQFEMDLEVQPDFKLPAYKAAVVKRPTRQITDADVEAQLKTFLERYAQLVPKLEGGAEVGDYVTADLTFHRDGQTMNEAKEVEFRIQPELRFQDGRVPDLARALAGARPGETRDADTIVGTASPDPSLRGQTIRVTFTVHDLKTLRLPEVDAAFLREVGFDSLDELKKGLRDLLERRLLFQQRQALRRELLDQLLNETEFELPPDLVSRQERATLRRLVNEMQEAGLSEAQIRAREAELRANAHDATLRSLKEFFLLSKIAEAEDLKVEEEDIDHEIEAIAARTDDSPRRIRARIEKEGLGEGLVTQIIERKTIDRILEYVKYEEVAMAEEQAVETLDQSASPAAADQGEGEASDVPSA
ncbi:MAG TPA: trigger factor [Isosphaeraceae bacterium]|jgi:trigger factor|nr:trigger factor [Isosphaeraceae bacterium]